MKPGLIEPTRLHKIGAFAECYNDDSDGYAKWFVVNRIKELFKQDINKMVDENINLIEKDGFIKSNCEFMFFTSQQITELKNALACNDFDYVKQMFGFKEL